MSLIRVYLLAKTFVLRNEHFQLVFKLKTTLLKIRAQGWYRATTWCVRKQMRSASQLKNSKKLRDCVEINYTENSFLHIKASES
jgi:hypothetical protein